MHQDRSEAFSYSCLEESSITLKLRLCRQLGVRRCHMFNMLNGVQIQNFVRSYVLNLLMTEQCRVYLHFEHGHCCMPWSVSSPDASPIQHTLEDKNRFSWTNLWLTWEHQHQGVFQMSTNTSPLSPLMAFGLDINIVK